MSGSLLATAWNQWKGGRMSSPDQAEPALPQSIAAEDFDAVDAVALGDERFWESHRSLLASFPDLRLDLQWKESAPNDTMVRARMRGTHRGEWRGIAPTGRPIDIFGIVTLQLDAQGAVVGTPGYMAPEQARGEIAQLDQRADIFSLGAILKFLISGSTAAIATASPPPRRLSAIVAKATAPAPGSRYASAQDLASDIASYLDGFPVSAHPESLLDRTVRLISRNRVAIVLVLAYLLARVLLIFWHPL